MLGKIHSWFAWPTFDDEETQRTALVLRAILLVGLFAAPTGGVFGLLDARGRPYSAPILTTVGVGVALVLAALFLLYHGRVRLAVAVVLSIIWLLGVVLSFASGGLYSPGVCYFFTAILFAGVMMGQRVGIGVAAASVTVVSLLLYLEARDVFFPNILYTSPFAVGLTHLLNLAWVTAAVQMYTRRITAALASVHRSNRELQAIRNTLAERVARRTADLTAANQRLGLIHLVDRAVLAAHSPADISVAVLEQLRQQMPCNRGAVLLLDAVHQRLVPLAKTVEGDTLFATDGEDDPVALTAHFGHLPETGTRVVPDLAYEGNRSPLEERLLQDGVRSFIMAPLLAQGQLIGTLFIAANRPHAYTAGHVQVVQEVANPVAIAIRQANLYESLETMNAELEEAIQSKDEMIANVSHELRTPLTQIMGYGDLLADEVLGSLSDEQRRAVNIVRDRARALNGLVNVLLAFQSLLTEQLDKEPVSISVLLDMVKQGWRDAAAQCRLTLDVSVPRGLPPVQADLLRLRQMMDQLVDNALKFTPAGGTVRVSAALQEGEIWLAVADTGIGIPPDKLELIFDRFYQLDGSSTRRYGGMGMGLALAKQIVGLHGGRIWAESDGVGRGATFRVALPVQGEAVAVRGWQEQPALTS